MIAHRIQRILDGFRETGLAGVRREIAAFFARRKERSRYQRWLAKHGSMTDREREAIRDEIAGFEHLPLISVILPVYNVDERWLRLCIGSVRDQIYPNWQLCIADDASTATHIRPILEDYAEADERIKTIFRDENGHISAASNSALELARGEFTVLLDHDDELSEDAMFCVAKEIVEDPAVQMIYSDEDVIDELGRRYDPKFKPDFARDFFYSLNLVTHLSAYRTSLLKELGGFRLGMEGSQDYDLALRVIERIDEGQIAHIPRILYHWRAIGTSVASGREAKPYAYEKAREALSQHFERDGVRASVEKAVHDLNRVRYKLDDEPHVSLIIFGESSSEAIKDELAYANVDVSTTKSSAPAQLNSAVRRSAGDVIVIVDGRLRPASDDWLAEMVRMAMQERIGAVGARIVDRTGVVRQVGMVMSETDGVRLTNAKADVYDAGYFFRAALAGNFSAISIACIAIRRDVFETGGGFDEGFDNGCFASADLCLRLRGIGYRIAYTPYAALTESVPMELSDYPASTDRDRFKQKWAEKLKLDPFYNPSLSKTDLFSVGD